MPDPLRVIIVDDHPGVVRALSRLLLAHDYNVVGNAADGSGLLEVVQHLEPDVIVLDINLPTIDGLTACRQITQVYPEIKIIMYTAGIDLDIERQAFEAGAAAFVSKVSGGEDLLSILKRLDADRG